MPKQNADPIENLAALTRREFLRIEKKMDGGFKTAVDILDLIRADIHDIKATPGPLVRSVVAPEETARTPDKRAGRLEEKTGLKFVQS